MNASKKALLNYSLGSILIGIEETVMNFFKPGTDQYTKNILIKKNYAVAHNFYIFFEMTWLLIFNALATYGFIKIKKNTLILFVVLIFAYLLLVSSRLMSYSRFRIPFLPLLVILIFSGIENIFKNLNIKFKFMILIILLGPLAKLDKALGYEPRNSRFEFWAVHQKEKENV